MTEAEKQNDSFWRVRPLIDLLNETFPAHYKPFQHLAVDEFTTPQKGRHRAKQYNKAKPCKWGFKSFALCCSLNAYMLQFEPYQGGDLKRTAGQSLGTYAVLVLLKPSYANKNHIMYFDNWFTSAGLLKELFERGIHACGTTRKGRKGQPSRKDLTMPANAKRGAVRVFQYNDATHVWKDGKM